MKFPRRRVETIIIFSCAWANSFVRLWDVVRSSPWARVLTTSRSLPRASWHCIADFPFSRDRGRTLGSHSAVPMFINELRMCGVAAGMRGSQSWQRDSEQIKRAFQILQRVDLKGPYVKAASLLTKWF